MRRETFCAIRGVQHLTSQNYLIPLRGLRGSSSLAKAADNAYIESAESFDGEVDTNADVKEFETPEYSEAEMQSFNSAVTQHTEGNYEDIDSLIAAHDTLYDQVEELKAQLENSEGAVQGSEEMDDFIKGLVEYYKETGDVSEYIVHVVRF